MSDLYVVKLKNGMFISKRDTPSQISCGLSGSRFTSYQFICAHVRFNNTRCSVPSMLMFDPPCIRGTTRLNAARRLTQEEWGDMFTTLKSFKLPIIKELDTIEKDVAACRCMIALTSTSNGINRWRELMTAVDDPEAFTIMKVEPTIEFSPSHIKKLFKQVKVEPCTHRCSACGVFIPNTEAFQNNQGQYICCFCMSRFGEQAVQMKERFRATDKELADQYEEAVFLRKL